MQKRILSLLITLLFYSSLYSQFAPVPTVSTSRFVDWAKAGNLPDTPTAADNVFDVTDYGAIANDGLDDFAACSLAIAAAKSTLRSSIIYFPEGTYTLETTIHLILEEDISGNTIFEGNIIFQGAGSDKTFLHFDLPGDGYNCFKFEGLRKTNIPVLNNISKGSKLFSATSLSSHVDDKDWIHFSQYESDSTTDSHHVLGQITQVESAASGTMKDEASKFYSQNDDLRVYKIKPLMNIGIENLKIKRLDTGHSSNGSTVKFNLAVNGWIKGVEFHNTCEHHVVIEYSSHIEVSGCYIHDINFKGDNGYGYGVDIAKSSTNCLVENNIFQNLRHAMLVQDGANANVFGYNYSCEQKWNHGNRRGSDITVHGDYAYSNLFESNWATNIWLDASHGWNGPFNTFLRNYTKEIKPILNFNAHYSNFVGNENCQAIFEDYGELLNWVNDNSSLLETLFPLWGFVDEELPGIYDSENVFDTYFHVFYEWPPPYVEWADHQWWYLVYNTGGAAAQNEYLDQAFLNDLSYYKPGIPEFFSYPADPWPGMGPFTNLDYDDVIEEHLFSIPAKWRWDNETLKTFNQETTVHPVEVIVDQKNSTNTSFGSFDLWETSWNSFSAPETFSFGPNNEKVIRSDQNINSNEKFNNWNDEEFLNFNRFNINETITTITAYHEPIDQATFTAQLHFGSGDVDIKFKDPWLRDLNELPYGLRNRGFNAVYISNTVPYTINSTTNNQGIFLAQDYNDPAKPYYSIKAETQTINGTTWDCYGWETSGASLKNANSNSTGIKFNQSNATLTAHYKGRLRSNLTSAYASNSQRKIVRIDDDIYHTVYVSDYYDIQNDDTYPVVYHAKSSSSDFEANWEADQIFPKCLQGQEVKNPSIDFYGHTLYLVYEYWDGLDFAGIVLVRYNTFSGKSDWEFVEEYDHTYYGNAKPVIAVTPEQLMVVWKGGSSEILKFRVQKNHYLFPNDNGVYVNGSPLWLSANGLNLSNSSTTSKNPSIAANKYDGDSFSNYYIVWQNSSSSVEYQYFEQNESLSAWNPDVTENQIISSGSGFTNHNYPSISLLSYNSYRFPNLIVTWRGSKKEYQSNLAKSDAAGSWVWIYKTVVRPKATSWGAFYETGNGAVSSSSINSSNNGNSVVLFSQNSGQESKYIVRDNAGTYAVNPLSHNGPRRHVSNAATLNDMKAIVFDNSSLPYTLTKSTTTFQAGINKISADLEYTAARQGVIQKDTLEFVFNMGDILLDGEPVLFKSRQDTLPVNTLQELNDATHTENFYLDNSSQLSFSDMYYTAKTGHADSVLTDEDEVVFQVELVRFSDGLVVGEMDKITYNKNSVEDHANIDYQLDCSGIGAGTYYLQLRTEVKGDAKFFLGNGHNSIEGLAKKNYINIGLSEISLPLTYKLSQNFPNPFNPVTTISYEVPKDSKVQIKVFDISGREVTTLVNDQKKAGRYQISFDAANLATGMYIYRFVSGNFVSQKKMVLIK